MTPIRRTRKPLPPRAARLFTEPDRPRQACVANVDGASRGNPGPASYGVVIRSPDGTVLLRMGKYLGRATNNVAEYYALVTALDFAVAHNIPELRIQSDSELLVRQMQGRYKVKSSSLRPLHEHARKLAARLAWVSFEHVPRERNEEADRLANEALDRTGGRPARDSAAEGETRKSKFEAREQRSADSRKRVRARYSGGALHPAEPLALPEGAEVEITIHKKN